MAYNPFDFFRRNQKMFFAVLTVVVMFMFVLQFGPGDFFSSVPRWFGGRSGDTLAEIDGRRVTEADFRTLRMNRNWANLFLNEAHRTTVNRVASYVEKGQPKASEELRITVQNLTMTRQIGYLDFQSYMQLQQRQLPMQYVPIIQQNQIGRLLQQFQTFVENKSAKTDDLELAKACRSLLILDAQGLFGGSSYFQTVPSDGKNANLMEFELWRSKANKMGVTYTRPDAEQLILGEFFGQFTADDWNKKENELLSLEGSKGFTRDRLRDALIDELKVRTAMTSVLGPQPGSSDDPSYFRARQAFASPYEQFQYYKQQCDLTNYSVITVPVANFIDKVREEPSVQELNDLFKRFKNDEPSPFREQPGLKEPRRVKLEWLEVKGDEPYFKSRAKEFLPKMEWLTRASGSLMVPAFPNLGSVLAAGCTVELDQPALQTAYHDYSRETREREKGLWYPIFGPAGNGFTDQSVVRPQALAAAAASMAASRMTMAGLFDPLVSLGASAMAAERDTRIRAGAALFLPHTLFTPYIVHSQMPQPLPLTVVANDLKVKVVDQYARQIAFDDLSEFRTKLTELGKPKDQAPARDYVEKFIKDRGLKTGTSQDYRDVFSIGDDPGLKPLKERSSQLHQGANLPNRFGPQFFLEQLPTGQIVESKSLFKPDDYPSELRKDTFVGTVFGPPPTDSYFLTWRTAELPAEAPKTLDARTREKAVAAWKRMKARELAKARAEALAKEAGEFGSSPIIIRQKVLDAQAALQKEFASKEAQDRVKYFPITNVAPLVTDIGFNLGRAPVSVFQITATETIPYPDPEKMRAELLENREKPLSTAFVMADQPKDTFYVTVLESKDPKTVHEFGQYIYAPPLTGMGPSQEILGQFRSVVDRKAREDAVALLKAELRYQKENPDLAKKGDSSD